MNEKNIVRYENKEEARAFLTVCLRYFDSNPKEKLMKISRKNYIKMLNKFEFIFKEVVFV